MSHDRKIRFKEWGILVDKTHTPTDDYLMKTNGSLPKKSYRLRTDANGNIVSGNDFPDNCENFILCLGDSFVESLFIEEKKRFSSILERNLVHNGFNFRVLNGGYSGATTLHLFINFITKHLASASKLKLLLFFQPFCDNFPLNMSSSYWNHHPFYTPIIDPDNNNLKGFDRSTDFTDLKKIQATLYFVCKQYNIPVVYIKTPFGNHVFEDSEFLQFIYSAQEKWEQRKAALERIQINSKNNAIECDIDIIDLSESINNDHKLFYDELHLNELGSLAVADVLYAKLASIFASSKFQGS